MTALHVEYKLITTVLLLGVAVGYSSVSVADNPVVQTNYTADPAPMVYDGRVYLYAGHDEDISVNNTFTMNDWRVYSTADMVNWTDHGSPLSYKSFSWSSGNAWASQCIPRNGKFYYYVTAAQMDGSPAIGVAVSTSPTGPFVDALGKPLAFTGTGDIDPTVFIDDDGQAYLYWGNPTLWYVKLNTDMISYAGTPTQVSLTPAGFGTRSTTFRATAYDEGPWFYKRGSLYYIVYPADGPPQSIDYTTSSAPLGPWTFGGIIMAKELGAGSSLTDHPGLVDFVGNSYLFYHNGALPGGADYRRSVCIEKFAYNADGTIPMIKATAEGPPAVANLNPFKQTEAETIAFSFGLKTEVCSEGGIDVTSINNGDYIKVRNVNFASGATSFDARIASTESSGSIELHLDSLAGTLIGTCAIHSTGGAQTWATQSCTVSSASGIHDLFLKFTGDSGDLFKLNWWKFSGPGANDGQNVDAASIDGAVTDAGTDARETGSAGSGGSGGSGTGTSGTGGVAVGSGGTLGAGGITRDSGSGGNAIGGAGGSILGSGGHTANGGATSANGGTGSGGRQTSPSSDLSGCSCQIASNRPSRPCVLLLLLLGAALIGHRKAVSRRLNS